MLSINCEIRLKTFVFVTVYPTLLAALMKANYTLIPTEDGVPHLVKIDYTPLTELELQTLAYNVESTTFTLFTRLELIFFNGNQRFVRTVGDARCLDSGL